MARSSPAGSASCSPAATFEPSPVGWSLAAGARSYPQDRCFHDHVEAKAQVPAENDHENRDLGGGGARWLVRSAEIADDPVVERGGDLRSTGAAGHRGGVPRVAHVAALDHDRWGAGAVERAEVGSQPQ